MDAAISVGITIVLILVNGYFSMSEFALISARRGVLQQYIEDQSTDKSKQAARALDLAQDSDRLLATIQIAITLVGFLASAFAATSFSGNLTDWLSSFGLGWLSTAAPILSIVIITLIVSYVTLVLGELLPKRIALSNAERTAMRVSGTVGVFQKILLPAVALLAASTNLLAHIFRIKKHQDPSEVAEEEIKILVSEQDSLLDEEKRMIAEIFDLGDTVAQEIMTPRVDMYCAESSQNLGEVVQMMQKTGYSRMPVIEDSPDKVVGVVMLKDLLEPLMKGVLSEPIAQYMRDAVFVPETKNILPLLSEMQTTKMQLAVVVDEYGGTAGLVSMEDIVEEIVGDIDDEYDPSTKYSAQLGDDIWMIDGRLPVEDAMEMEFPITAGEGYETVAGWMMDVLDTLPQKGEVLEAEGYVFTVQSVRKNRIAMIRVVKEEPDSQAAETAEE